MRHVFLTKFNIPVKYGKSPRYICNNIITLGDACLDFNYLEYRFNIFEKFTLRSMLNQTNQFFDWYCFFHKDTPDCFKLKIENYKKNMDNFFPVFLGEDETNNLSNVCKNILLELDDDHIITTRIDNDDMIRNDFVEITQKQSSSNGNFFISFPYGIQYVLNEKIALKQFHVCNHWLSFNSTGRDLVHVLMFNHSLIYNKGYKILQLNKNEYMYVEVIHDANHSNTIKDGQCINDKDELESINRLFYLDAKAINVDLNDVKMKLTSY